MRLQKEQKCCKNTGNQLNFCYFAKANQENSAPIKPTILNLAPCFYLSKTIRFSGVQHLPCKNSNKSGIKKQPYENVTQPGN